MDVSKKDLIYVTISVWIKCPKNYKKNNHKYLFKAITPFESDRNVLQSCIYVCNRHHENDDNRKDIKPLYTSLNIWRKVINTVIDLLF